MLLLRTIPGLFLAGLCLTGCSSPSQPAPIYFGHIATLSGPGRDVGQAAYRGIHLAVIEADKDPARGAGRQVKIIHTDTLGKLTAFEAEAVRLSTVNRVSALLGGRTLEEIEMLERARVPIVSPCGVRPRSGNEMVFCTGISPEQQGQVLARFAGERFGGKPVLVLADENADGSATLGETFARAVQAGRTDKKTKVSAARPPVLRYGKDIALAELVKRVREEKPAVVLLAGTVADLRTLCLQLDEKGPAVLFGGEDGSSQPIREARMKGAVYLVTAFVTEAEEPRAQEFVKKYRETFSEEPGIHAALAYDNARLLFEATRRTEDNPTVNRLREKLAELKDYPGLTGALSFDKDRQLLRPAYVVRVENGLTKVQMRYAAGE